jgi:hypothetical protein
VIPSPPLGSAAAAARMATAAALFAAADAGWDADAPLDEPAWLAEQDDPRADPLAGLTDDQIRAVLEPEALGAGFTHRGEATRAAARGRGGSGFAAGGPLDVMEPGPALAKFTDDAHAAKLGRLTDDELVGMLGAARRLQSWQAGVELSVVAELDRRRAAGKPQSSREGEHVSAELAVALALTGRSADSLLGLARGLARLPDVLAALLAGRIDLARARVFADELAQLDDAKAGQIAAEVIGVAGSMTTARLRNLLRRLILLTDAEALRRRADAARKDARVECFGEGSGNGALAGRELPRADAIAVDARIKAIAIALKDAGADGTMDQIRAAVFLALLSGKDPADLLPGPDAGQRQATGAGANEPGGTTASPLAGLSGSVHLVMPLSAWLGDFEEPGEATGYGTIDAGTVRDLAGRLAGGNARWCVTQVTSDGRAATHACAHSPPRPGAKASWLASLRFTALESGTCTHIRQSPAYRPRGLLAHLVRVRQRTCIFPGCRRRAADCDLDHTRPYDQGGLTCECNLSPICRKHHRAKQATGWKLEQPQPGIMTWRLPHGRSYQEAGEPYPV